MNTIVPMFNTTNVFVSFLLTKLTGLPRWLSGKESSANAGDVGLSPGSGRPPGGGNGNPLQYSCLEKPTDRGAWWATVCGVTKELDTTEQLNDDNKWGPTPQISRQLTPDPTRKRSLTTSQLGHALLSKTSLVTKHLHFTAILKPDKFLNASCPFLELSWVGW